MSEVDTQTLTEIICDLIGYERLDEICNVLGGLRWKIPMKPPIEKRNERIIQEFNLIMSVKNCPARMGTYRALARKYRISESKVREILQ